MPPSRSPKRSRSRRKRRPGQGQHWRLLAAVLFLAGFVAAGLLLLLQLRPESPAPRLHYEEPPAVRRQETSLERLRTELESLLLRSGYGWSQVEIREAGDILEYAVRGGAPPGEFWVLLDERLRRIDPALVLETEGELRARILEGNRIRVGLRFAPQRSVERPAPSRPRVAIVIDDLGRDLETVAALLDLELSLTFAILPGELNASRAAELVHRRGGEVLIHIPMEPRSYPETDPGRDALLVGMPGDEIRRRFRGFLQQVPHAIGGNNHMGSRFTEDRVGMRALHREMGATGLFFLDSRTTANTVAGETAREVGLPHLSRDIFLDNVAEVDYVAGQLRQLLLVARRQGQAVGIGHPHPATVAALRREAETLRSSGVELVTVSSLLPGRGE